MASFSDDEQMFEVDSVLDQRKRKGIVEYLVQWKETEAGGKDKSWEPAARIAADCANAVAAYIKSKTRKRSQSKTRKPSRSRSRSSSRSRKLKTEKVAVRRSTRSTSRGRSSKIPVSEKKAEEQKPLEEVVPVQEKTEVVAQASVEQTVAQVSVEQTVAQKSVEQTESISSFSTTESVVTNSQAEVVTLVSQAESVASTSSTSTVSATVGFSTSVSDSVNMSEENQTKTVTSSSDRVLRSARNKTEELEVQRVHTELRPEHKDDGKPRSSVWKVADYLVIALFVLSVLAAIFLFVEKFVDLKDFKPNLGTLQTRLTDGVQSLLDVCRSVGNWANEIWLRLMDLLGSAVARKPTVVTTKN